MAGENLNKQGIKTWARDDRPREKLLFKGYHALSESELIAILLGSGMRNKSAVDVAKELLSSAEGDLNKLGKFSIKQIQRIKGIGEAKAITIASALELGRRRKNADIRSRRKIGCSKDVYDYMYSQMADLDHEHFYVLLLSRSNQILRHYQISKGGVAGTVVDPKLVFRLALEELASSMILCHNHPSGNLNPSQSDIDLTRKLKQGGSFLDIKVLDHLIFSNDGYYSFADEGSL